MTLKLAIMDLAFDPQFAVLYFRFRIETLADRQETPPTAHAAGKLF